MKIKSMVAIAALLMAASAITPAYAANRKDVNKLIDTGRCQGCNLRDADLSGQNLRGADLQGADLQGAKLQKASLRAANLRNANLAGANLTEADLTLASLRDANLGYANLRGASLEGSEVVNTNFIGADLTAANVKSTGLPGDIRLQGTNARVPLVFLSRTTEDVKVIVEGNGYKQEVNFGGSITKARIDLPPARYRLTFLNGSGSRTWMTGTVNLDRGTVGPVRMFFNRSAGSVAVENDAQAWNSD